MRNKLDIHKVEEIGFFITMTIVSVIVGMAIVISIIKLVDIFNN